LFGSRIGGKAEKTDDANKTQGFHSSHIGVH
jgi:hypothetical protein